MNAMTVLRRCREADEDMRQLRQHIGRRRDTLTGAGGLQVGNPVIRETGDPDKLGRVLADIDALERQLEERRQRHACEAAAACVLLDSLPGTVADVLHGYYVRGESTAVIARRLKYTASYVRRLKRDGEQLLAAVSAEEVAAALPKWYTEGGKG